MSNTVQALILNALLDKYESSISFREDRPIARRFMLNFYNCGKSDFPYYDIEQSERRESVNRAVLYLDEKSLVSYEWMKGEYEHFVAKVWLNTEKLSLAYLAAGREPKGNIVDKICAEIAETKEQVKSAWACAFLQDAYDDINRKRNIGNAIPADDEERLSLLQAIVAIDKLDGEAIERVFSLQVFCDSKKFERSIKARLLSILRKYTDNDDDATEEDLLKQVGIVKYPEQFELCGNCFIVLPSGTVQYSCLPSGGVVYSTDFSSGRIVIDLSIDSVITIENRANYIEYIRKTKADNDLVIYHGGQYSPRKRFFLQAVAKAMPARCRWYHWSDIDYGGFLMLSRIRREIVQEAIPYRMNTEELDRYSKFTAPIKAKYAEKLKSLKNHMELSDVFVCIDYMLENKVRLEQEAILTD